jgi:hypothetical protein
MKKNEEYWLNLYNEGKIKIDFETGEVWSFLQSDDGYLLGSKTKPNNWYLTATSGPSRKERYHILLHRLIWTVANGDIPDKIEVNHINGIKWDNRLENLELTTKSGNALHSRRVLGNKGGSLKGEEHPKAKLKEWQILEIREKYDKNISTVNMLAKEYNTSYPNIMDIVKRRHWKEVT